MAAEPFAWASDEKLLLRVAPDAPLALRGAVTLRCLRGAAAVHGHVLRHNQTVLAHATSPALVDATTGATTTTTPPPGAHLVQHRRRRRAIVGECPLLHTLQPSGEERSGQRHPRGRLDESSKHSSSAINDS